MAMQDSRKTSLSQRIDDYRPSKMIIVWACVATAAATMIIGFNWGGWVTGSTSRAEAATAGDVARGELASAICVERFNAATDAPAKRAEFKAIPDNYKKRQFVEEGGWATGFAALLFHEFATNAAKYGALSVPGGGMDIRCEDQGATFVLTWRERGGPRIARAPDGDGFGSLLARSTVRGQLGGEIEREWKPEGLFIRLVVATDRLAG